MLKRVVSVILFMLVTITGSRAATIAIDMDTADGLQGSLTANDTAGTIAVALRITGADHLFSYQCKVHFDTARFSYVGAQQDFGVTGEKNILQKNGGSVIGIYQLQQNPAAADTVEFSGSITGTDASKEVSGDGLIGVLYLKAKMNYGDSADVSAALGFTASAEGELAEVESCGAGTYSVMPVVHAKMYNPGSSGTGEAIVNLAVPSRSGRKVFLAIPGRLMRGVCAATLQVVSIDGKDVAACRVSSGSSGVAISSGGMIPGHGIYICRLDTGAGRFTATLSVP